MVGEQLTHDEKLMLLEEWLQGHLLLSEQIDRIGSYFDSATGPLFDAAWGVFDGYTGAVSKLIGDAHGWLNWFQHENNMGTKGLEAGFDGDLRAIRSVNDLLWLIEVDE